MTGARLSRRAALGALASPLMGQGVARPNIVVVLVDDLGDPPRKIDFPENVVPFLGVGLDERELYVEQLSRFAQNF